jgi:hypothetical protein
MGVCPVCNCKTDELDFTACTIGEKEYKICSFCQRQLKGFDNNSEPTEAQLKWLSAVISKDVPDRDIALKTELEKIYARYSQNPFAVENTQPISSQKAPKAYGATTPPPAKKTSPAHVTSDNEIIRQLQQRVDGLEAEIRMMKRKQMIKTIIELGAPFAMLILLLIVFFASGLYDSIKEIMTMAGI